MKALPISGATRAILDKGHPWVVRDRATGDTKHLQLGQVLPLRCPDGKLYGQALIEPKGKIVARLLSRDTRPLGAEDFLARARRALALRAALFADPEGDSFRCIHGEADGLPGLWLDLFGGRAVATLRSPAARGFLPPALQALRERRSPEAVLVREHFADLRKSKPPRDRWSDGSPASSWEARELGCRYEISSDAALGLGLYADQRPNRRRMLELLAGVEAPRVLNLFCYTGAFSVAAARQGARVDSVDLSAAALDVLRENLARNDLDPERCPLFAEDVRRFLKRAKRVYDLIVLDPPTFSKGKKGGFFSAQKELAALAGQCLARLRPGGALLCSSNASKLQRPALVSALAQEGRRRGRSLQILEGPGPGIDFPVLPGFPEGVISKSVWCRVPG